MFRNLVYFYNFQWKDYSIVTDEVVLDMVKVMTFALTEGKVINDRLFTVQNYFN